MELIVSIILIILFIAMILGFINPTKVLFWDKKPTRFKVFGFWILSNAILSILLAVFSVSDSDVSSKMSSKVKINDEIDSEKYVDSLKISFEQQGFDGDKMKMVVWIENKSEFIADGKLNVDFKTKQGNTQLGFDIIEIKNLNPSEKTYAIIWIKKSNLTAIMNYELPEITFRKDETKGVSVKNASYKFISDKIELGNKLEFYYSNNKDFEKMFEFIKNRKVNPGTIYYAVFINDESFAYPSKYPISAMSFDEKQSKHIIATYIYNTKNNFKEFTYYDKNSWDSSPNILK